MIVLTGACSSSASAAVNANGAPVRVSLASSSRVLAHGIALVDPGRVAGVMPTVSGVAPRSIFALFGEQFHDYWESGTWDEDL